MDKVIAMSLVYYFFGGTECTLWIVECNMLYIDTQYVQLSSLL